MSDDDVPTFGRRATDAMISPALEVLRQTPAAAAVVMTAWLFLAAQERASAAQERAAEATAAQAHAQTAAVLTALGQTGEALSANTRAMARVELLLQQSTPPADRNR